MRLSKAFIKIGFIDKENQKVKKSLKTKWKNDSKCDGAKAAAVDIAKSHDQKIDSFVVSISINLAYMQIIHQGKSN